MARRLLPFAGLQIPDPCSVPWNEMRPELGGRHCDQCDRVVRDLTHATSREAYGLAFLYGSGGLCARVNVNDQGQTLFREVVAPRNALFDRGALVAMGSSLVVAGAGCSDVPARSPSPPPAIIATLPSASASPTESASPVVDSDHDGIADQVDKCPAVAGEPPDGCPPTRRGIVVTTSGDLLILEQPRFASGSSRVQKDTEQLLQATVDALKANPQILQVEVHGHTDIQERNGAVLSRERADHVIDWFVAHGLERSRFIPLGEGSKMPIDTNATSEGREKNRRVELRIVPVPSNTST